MIPRISTFMASAILVSGATAIAAYIIAQSASVVRLQVSSRLEKVAAVVAAVAAGVTVLLIVMALLAGRVDT